MKIKWAFSGLQKHHDKIKVISGDLIWFPIALLSSFGSLIFLVRNTRRSRQDLILRPDFESTRGSVPDKEDM